jgi:hypothetical protein
MLWELRDLIAFEMCLTNEATNIKILLQRGDFQPWMWIVVGKQFNVERGIAEVKPICPQLGGGYRTGKWNLVCENVRDAWMRQASASSHFSHSWEEKHQCRVRSVAKNMY